MGLPRCAAELESEHGTGYVLIQLETKPEIRRGSELYKCQECGQLQWVPPRPPVTLT